MRKRDFNSPSDQPIAKRVCADLASGYSSAKHCCWWQSLSILFLFDGWSLRNFDIFTTFNGDVYIETMKYIIYIGVPEGMDLDPNQNFVDPYMALIKCPGSQWERMRTYMIPLIARSSLL